MKASFRGAVSSDNNEMSIREAVCTLWDSLVKENSIKTEEISCIIFSQTKDLDAFNCASALRQSGNITDIPLFCVQEADVKNSAPFMIRILIVSDRTIKSRKEVHHVYLGKASQLRPDLVMRKDASNNP